MRLISLVLVFWITPTFAADPEPPIRFGLTAEEAVAAFTRVGAGALGLAADRGTLEVGKLADLVIWDVAHPAELPYRIAHNPCHTTIKAGAVCHQAGPMQLQ